MTFNEVTYYILRKGLGKIWIENSVYSEKEVQFNMSRVTTYYKECLEE